MPPRVMPEIPTFPLFYKIPIMHRLIKLGPSIQVFYVIVEQRITWTQTPGAEF